MQKHITTNFRQTQKMGETFAHTLKGGDIVALYGILGSGKTTFVQGIARGLGITRKIISPTFIVMRNYKLGEGKNEYGIKEIYHIDLYRITDRSEAQGLGIFELFTRKDTITLI